MLKNILIKLFGANYETTIGGIFTVIGLIPSAIQYIGIEQMPGWLKTAGIVCSGLSYLYAQFKAKSKTVSGIEGQDAIRKEERI